VVECARLESEYTARYQGFESPTFRKQSSGCYTYFMKHIELIVRLIIIREDTVLLCKSKEDGHYFLPGGHVEFGDTLEKTIYKEMEEELGLKEEQVSNISYKKYFENTYGEGDKMHHEINFIFDVNIPNDFEIISKEDHIDFEWIPLSEIQNVNFLPKNILS
jgi:8-oxo-dGTP diphosphatase